jgi:hypothetical protein
MSGGVRPNGMSGPCIGRLRPAPVACCVARCCHAARAARHNRGPYEPKWIKRRERKLLGLMIYLRYFKAAAENGIVEANGSIPVPPIDQTRAGRDGQPLLPGNRGGAGALI